MWNAFTYSTERFESDGLENRLVTFLAILPVAGLAVWGEGGLSEHYVGSLSPLSEECVAARYLARLTCRSPVGRSCRDCTPARR